MQCGYLAMHITVHTMTCGCRAFHQVRVRKLVAILCNPAFALSRCVHRDTGDGRSNDQEENQGTNNTSHSEQSKMQADFATLQSFSTARTYAILKPKMLSP